MSGARPKWLDKLPMDMIKNQSLRFGLDWRLVAAICWNESAGKSFSCRYEPGYKYLYRVDEIARNVSCTPDTMRNLQMMSWGLMQVMGALAYEIGFPLDQYCTQLVLPNLGIEWGCRNLVRLWRKNDTLDKVVASYNAGSVRYTPAGRLENQAYVDRVMSLILECGEK